MNVILQVYCIDLVVRNSTPWDHLNDKLGLYTSK